MKTLIIVLLLTAFGAGLGMYSSSYYTSKINAVPEIQGLMWPNPKQLRPFASINQSGDVFGLDNLQGKWSFIFFGYTHCPDVCPITLSLLDDVHKKMQDKGINEDIQIIFMTVDPERDTTELLKDYIEYFNTEFIALGGTKEQVESLTRQIGIAYAKAETGSDNDYLVDHSASVFLIGPKGHLISVFSSPHDATDILNRFIGIKGFIQKQDT